MGRSVLAFWSRTLREDICLPVAVGLALSATAANAATVRVRAGSRLDGRVAVLVASDADAPAQPDPGSPPYQVVISGSLRDDVGDPIPSGRVTVSCRANGVDTSTPTIVMALHDAEPCHTQETATAPPSAASASEYPIDTNADGAFCLRSMLTRPPATVRLRFDGDPFRDPASVDLPVDPARPALAISFEPAPRVVSLDEKTLPVDVRLYAPGGAVDAGIELGGVRLRLSDELGRRLGGAISNADGRTHFDINVSELRDPGPGELRIDVDGSASAFTAHASRSIERHAKVAIVAVGSTLHTSDDGVRVRLQARWARGAVPGGAIEATVGRQSAGSAIVRNGVADVTMAFDSSAVADPGVRQGATATRVTRIDFHYLPDAPWWEPGEMTAIAVPLRASNPWRGAPLALVAIVIGAWMLRGSWQPRARKDRVSSVPRLPIAAQGAIRLTRIGAKSDGYRGQVLDAHDGSPLVAAVISIVATAFPTPVRPRHGDEIAEAHPTPEVETDEHGRFSFRATPFSAGAHLRARAPWHETLEQPLPQPGELTVHLVSRRRHLLSRLIDWSRSERALNHAVVEPTPRQVASGHGGDVGVWANAVEAAAFGPTPVDEQREKTVLMLEPRPHGQSKSR